MSFDRKYETTVLVQGQPQPQPRPRCTCIGGRPHLYHGGKAIKEWRRKIYAAILKTEHSLITRPIAIYFTFRIKRPKSHFKVNDPTKGLKPSSPEYHDSGFDLDNLVKPVMDEMKRAKWIDDDAQVISMSANKEWVVSSPSCVFTVTDILAKAYAELDEKEGRQ